MADETQITLDVWIFAFQKGERKPCHHEKGTLKSTIKQFDSLDLMKNHAKSFLGLKSVMSELGINHFTIKLGRGIKTTNGPPETKMINTQDQWEHEREMIRKNDGVLQGELLICGYLIICKYNSYMS